MASSFVKRPQGQSSGAERPNHQRASTMSEHPRLMGLIYDRILPPPDTYSQYLFGPQPLQHGVSDLGPDGQAWSTDLGEHHANFPRNQGPARDEAYRRRYSTVSVLSVFSSLDRCNIMLLRRRIMINLPHKLFRLCRRLGIRV